MKTVRDSSARLTSHEGRVFAFTLTAGFVFLALLFRSRDMRTATIVSQYVAAATFVAGVVVPTQLRPLRRAWMKLGEAIGHVTTPILMGLVYYLLFTPLGLVRRRLAKTATVDPDSYWIQRDPLPARERMERQF